MDLEPGTMDSVRYFPIFFFLKKRGIVINHPPGPLKTKDGRRTPPITLASFEKGFEFENATPSILFAIHELVLWATNAFRTNGMCRLVHVEAKPRGFKVESKLK